MQHMSYDFCTSPVSFRNTVWKHKPNAYKKTKKEAATLYKFSLKVLLGPCNKHCQIVTAKETLFAFR